MTLTPGTRRGFLTVMIAWLKSLFRQPTYRIETDFMVLRGVDASTVPMFIEGLRDIPGFKVELEQ